MDVPSHDSVTGIPGVIGDLGRLDRALYGVIADTPTPNLDVPLRELSSLASHSKIWFAIAGGLALFGGERGRRCRLDRCGVADRERSGQALCATPSTRS